MKRTAISLTNFQLKCIGALLMVMDHLRAFFPALPLWFRYLGRLSAPIFFFLTVEGFFHTSNRGRYAGRLLAGGFIMAAGSRILTHLFPSDIGLYNNIFFSLGLGVALMSAWQQLEETGDEQLFKPVLFLILLAMLLTEANIYGIMMVLVFYQFRERKELLAAFYILGSLIPSLLSPLSFKPPLNITYNLSVEQFLVIDYQWMMVFAVPFFSLYNGELGSRSPQAKWFFYIFYPAHLWILYLASYWFN
ncbi:MAG: conjugal transfer protein TraX [Firmicutes bacterium]|nr:conjugal transfer protein TraX [Bacillota bacterium]